jgi:hypothetical protein
LHIHHNLIPIGHKHRQASQLKKSCNQQNSPAKQKQILFLEEEGPVRFFLLSDGWPIFKAEERKRGPR